MAATAPPVAGPAAASPPSSKSSKWVLIIVGLVSLAAGAALPLVVDLSTLMGHAPESVETSPIKETKTAIISFGDVIVNLADERAMRYLRVKIAVVVDASKEKEVESLLTKKKPAVKSKLISHLAGKTLKDVTGTVGVNRLQREILERFDEVLYPEGESPLRAVLFEEYVVQ